MNDSTTTPATRGCKELPNEPGVYLVASLSEPHRPHRVDTRQRIVVCDCNSFANSRRMTCIHVRTAISAANAKHLRAFLGANTPIAERRPDLAAQPREELFG